jgi:PPP family 3-phenylpropionic acid transporter
MPIPICSSVSGPSGMRRADARSARVSWLALFRLGAFVQVVAIAALVHGSHAMYDSFAVIRWTEAGIAPATAAALWSASVAAEVVGFCSSDLAS